MKDFELLFDRINEDRVRLVVTIGIILSIILLIVLLFTTDITESTVCATPENPELIYCN